MFHREEYLKIWMEIVQKFSMSEDKNKKSLPELAASLSMDSRIESRQATSESV